MTRRLHDLLLWLSAVDRAVLARCPEGEEKRFVASGGAVLATAGMAFVAGTFTFAKFLHAPLLLAALLGLGFALLIMNLERYVQASLRRQSHWLLTLASAAPRIALSYFMGLVITIPLMLAIFATEVGKQVVEDRNAALSAARADLEDQFADIPRLRREKTELEQRIREIKPGVVLEQSPEYQALARRIGKLKEWVRSTPNPKLVRSYQRQINRIAPQIKQRRKELLDAEAVATSAAHTRQQARIVEITPKLSQLETEKASRDTELKARFDGPAGLAAHVTALNRVAADQPGVGTVKDALVIFLVAVDTLPTLLLTLLLVGRKSTYEITQDAEEASAGKIAGDFETRRHEAMSSQAEAHFQAQLDIAKVRLKKQLHLQREMDEIFIDVVGDQLRPTTERLARDAAADYSRQMSDPYRAAPSPEMTSARDSSLTAWWRRLLGRLSRAGLRPPDPR